MAPNNSLNIHGNEKTMNLNHLILTNIQSSPYFKVNLYELKTYHEVIDEIYYKVNHLEPWEKGSRKTAGQTGMCGGVRGVGAGGIVSSCFCLLYKLCTLKLTRKQVIGLMEHSDSPYIRALGFMYIRYTQPPADYWEWYNPYLEDEEEVDVKAGGGHIMTIGEVARQWMTKIEWYTTLFPRIPVPIQKMLEGKLREYDANKAYEPPPQAVAQDSRPGGHIPDGQLNFGEAERLSQLRGPEEEEAPARSSPLYDRPRLTERNSHDRPRPAERDSHDRTRPTKRDSHDRTRPTERDSHDRTRPTERDSHDRTRPTERDSHDRTRPTERDSHDRTRPTERDYPRPQQRERDRERRDDSHKDVRRRSRSRSRDSRDNKRRRRSRSHDRPSKHNRQKDSDHKHRDHKHRHRSRSHDRHSNSKHLSKSSSDKHSRHQRSRSGERSTNHSSSNHGEGRESSFERDLRREKARQKRDKHSHRNGDK